MPALCVTQMALAGFGFTGDNSIGECTTSQLRTRLGSHKPSTALAPAGPPVRSKHVCPLPVVHSSDWLWAQALVPVVVLTHAEGRKIPSPGTGACESAEKPRRASTLCRHSRNQLGRGCCKKRSNAVDLYVFSPETAQPTRDDGVLEHAENPEILLSLPSLPTFHAR